MNSVIRTQFDFPRQTGVYTGKVRDVYTIDNRILVMIATDRISAFDIVFPRGITYKGQILNRIASDFLDLTADIVPNWKIASPFTRCFTSSTDVATITSPAALMMRE